MDSSSNQVSFATLTGTYPAVKIASGTGANTDTLVCSGGTHASILLDLLFRSKDGTARNFDIIICPTGSNTTDYYNRLQVSVPANSGNNGSTAIASLAGVAPALFDIDLAGNRVITLETGISVYVRNIATTAGDIFVTAKLRSF